MSKYKGRHRKATRFDKTVAKAALVGVGASVVPLTFMSGNAHASSIDSWDRIAECESNQRWNLPYGDFGRSSGGLQFQPASWNDALAYLRRQGIDTSGYPQGSGHQAYKATKKQQIIAGEALLALQGPSAWACNSMVGYPLGASMFEGGINPYPGGTTTTPAPKPTPAPPKPKKDKPVKNTPVNKGKEKSNKATYTVVSGDTLYDIAIAHSVGNGGLDTWKPLYKANKKVVGDNPHYILPGQVLHIPGVKPEKADKVKEKKNKDKVNSVEYTVRKGDTLSYLAQYYYGDASEYPRIFNANRPPLHSDPNSLEIGMKLTIPGTSKDAPPKRNVSSPVTNTAGYVSPLAAGTYRIGDNLIVGSGGSMSRSAGGHSGLDLSAPAGTQVKAIAAGTVVHSGYGGAGAAYGDHVIIKHKDGKYTLYGHLSSHTVSKGQTVAAGRWIGNVGSTGNSSGAHLHFEVRNSATAFSAGVFSDPVAYLRSHGVTL